MMTPGGSTNYLHMAGHGDYLQMVSQSNIDAHMYDESSHLNPQRPCSCHEQQGELPITMRLHENKGYFQYPSYEQNYNHDLVLPKKRPKNLTIDIHRDEDEPTVNESTQMILQNNQNNSPIELYSDSSYESNMSRDYPEYFVPRHLRHKLKHQKKNDSVFSDASSGFHSDSSPEYHMASDNPVCNNVSL